MTRDQEQVRDAVNARLHRAFGVDDPCATACTHVVHGEWTALGIAYVIARFTRSGEDADA